MTIPGISVVQRSQATIRATARSIDRACFIGFATPVDAVNLNALVPVSDLFDFSAKFTGASDTLIASIRVFFRNYPEGRLYFWAALSPDAAITIPTDYRHILYAYQQLSKRGDLSLHILAIPDSILYTVQAERTAVFSGADALSTKLRWLHFSNTSSATDTKEEALAERDLYASPFGFSSLYYGLGVDLESKRVPVAAIATAVALQRFRDSPFSPPAGARYPIQGITDIVGYVDFVADYEELQGRGINVIQKIPLYGYCLWGANTLSTNEQFININSRLAMSVVSREIEYALIPMLFESSDPQGFTRREVLRIVVAILEDAYVNGALSGDISTDSYRVIESEVVQQDEAGATQQTTTGNTTGNTSGTVTAGSTNPIETIVNLRRIRTKVYARFVETLQMIEVQLFNVDSIPTGESS